MGYRSDSELLTTSQTIPDHTTQQTDQIPFQKIPDSVQVLFRSPFRFQCPLSSSSRKVFLILLAFFLNLLLLRIRVRSFCLRKWETIISSAEYSLTKSVSTVPFSFGIVKFKILRSTSFSEKLSEIAEHGLDKLFKIVERYDFVSAELSSNY